MDALGEVSSSALFVDGISSYRPLPRPTVALGIRFADGFAALVFLGCLRMMTKLGADSPVAPNRPAIMQLPLVAECCGLPLFVSSPCLARLPDFLGGCALPLERA